MIKKVEISYKTVVFTVLFLIFVWFLYFIKDLILEFFVALLIMSILNPLVTSLAKFRVPKSLAVLLTYLLIFAAVGGAIAGVVPPLIEQTTNFANDLPRYLSTLGVGTFISQASINEFLSQIGSVPVRVVNLVISAFSNLLTVLFVLTLSFYMVMASDKLDDQLVFFFGEERKQGVKRVLNKLEERLGGWVRGQLTLMLVIGIANFIGLSLLGIPYALSLAILAGLLEIVPYIGPILSAAIPTIIGFSISPVMGVAVLIMAFLVQQVENYVLVPKVMEKSVGVSPIITLLALTVGFRLFGFIGILISVPLVITIQAILQEYIFRYKSA